MVSKKDLIERCESLGLPVKKNLSKDKIEELLEEYLKNKENIKLLKDNNVQIEHIYHLADIHIRYLDRHDEYRQVFLNLIEQIKTNNYGERSIMVICGDIFHSRDKFISETILLFHEFIMEISKHMDILIILGNHDCFSSRDRLDTISGIADIAHYPRTFVLKDSGIYKYNNLIFGVSSILDGIITRCPPKSEGLTYIALYHGIVSGCVLENNNTPNGLSIDNFDSYDIVLLGDIHKKQFLNKMKTIAYPGSFIQQNFKEDLDHGYLLWNVNTRSADFIPVKNEHGFFDIDVSNFDRSTNFTKFSKIRLLINPEDVNTDKNTENIIEYIKEKTTIKSIKKILKNSKPKEVDISKIDKIKNCDEKEEEIISQIIQEEISLEKILKVHKELSVDIEEGDMNFKESLPWTIERVDFKNIFSYGNDNINTIYLKDGITGILAGNASGKTNILNTILYGLFGNIYTRNQNQNNRNIISRTSNTKELYVKLYIKDYNNVSYFIERTAKERKRGTDKLLLNETLNFYKEENDITVSLNDSDKNKTETCLRETLSFLGKEEFILTNMMSNISYGNNMSVISMSGSQLDDVFNNMFNLNKYKLLSDRAKVLYKQTSIELTEIQSKIDLLRDMTGSIDTEKIGKDIASKNLNVTQLQKQKSDHSENLKTLEDKLLKLKQIDIQEDRTTLLKIIKENEEYINEDGVIIKDLLQHEEEMEEKYNILKEKYKDNNYEKYKNIHFSPNSSIPKENIQELEKKISYLEGQKTSLKNLNNGITNEYMEAKKKLEEYEKTKSIDIEGIKTLLEDLPWSNELSSYLLNSESKDFILENLNYKYLNIEEISKYQEIIYKKEENDKLIQRNILIGEQINSLKKSLKYNIQLDARDTRNELNYISGCLDKIETYYENEELKEKLKILEDNTQLNELLANKKYLQDNIDTISKEIQSLKKDINLLEDKNQMYIDNTSKINHYEDRLSGIREQNKLFKEYIRITHSKNLPKLLISNIVKNICKEANIVIYNLTGLICEIQENEKWEIVIKKQSITVGPEHCSGYERFIINTLLKLSFDKYKQLSSIKLFLIDEVIDCVSEDNFDNIDTLFDYIKSYYNKILLISHNEELKMKVDRRINIEVRDKCSYIV